MLYLYLFFLKKSNIFYKYSVYKLDIFYNNNTLSSILLLFIIFEYFDKMLYNTFITQVLSIHSNNDFLKGRINYVSKKSS